MYKEIEEEFAPQFEGTKLDLMKEYNHAISRVSHYGDDDTIKRAVKNILSEVLAEYSRSKGKTKVGKFFRWISRIFNMVTRTQ